MNYFARAPRDAMDGLHLEVAALIRDVALGIIMPRFRLLHASDVSEKSPGEIVTIADHEAEHALAEGLLAILPSARVIGEEACEADPALLVGLDRGLVWIVDPLDGTANFAAGREPFGLIVALARDGVTIAAWLYNPVTDRLCYASQGLGAYVVEPSSSPRQIRTQPVNSRPIAALATQFMPDLLRREVVRVAEGAFDLRPIPRCAAEHYPMLALGENHVALFQRTLPWDHAAGALLLTEAGGYVGRWDGSPYRFHDDGLGIIAASTPSLWADALGILVGEESALSQARTLVLQPQRHSYIPPGSDGPAR